MTKPAANTASRTVTGLVFDPYAGRPKAGPAGRFKCVREGRLAWPYTGPAACGETVTFEFVLPTADEIKARAAQIRRERGWVTK